MGVGVSFVLKVTGYEADPRFLLTGGLSLSLQLCLVAGIPGKVQHAAATGKALICPIGNLSEAEFCARQYGNQAPEVYGFTYFLQVLQLVVRDPVTKDGKSHHHYC